MLVVVVFLELLYPSTSICSLSRFGIIAPGNFTVEVVVVVVVVAVSLVVVGLIVVAVVVVVVAAVVVVVAGGAVVVVVVVVVGPFLLVYSIRPP